MKKITIALLCLSFSFVAQGLLAQASRTKAKAVVIKKAAPKTAAKETVKETPKATVGEASKDAGKEIPKEKAFDYGYGPADAAVITLGPQVWIAKNLAVTTFANGDKIEQVQSDQEWINAGKEQRPAWCYYANDPANGPIYGVLYNWWAVADPRGLAPAGWHVPTKYEWLPFFDFLGGKAEGGHKLKSTALWQPIGGPDRNGSNETGFGAVPGGLRFAADGTFSQLGERCQFWTATENESERGAMVYLGISHEVDNSIAQKGFGYSVRCVKD
ncbi:MAG: fibrobacter succinogenes major paralogous domain-containing protein [Bacteroidota bacterium]